MTRKYSFVFLFLFSFTFYGQVDAAFLKRVKASVTEAISFGRNDFKSDSQFWTMVEDTDGSWQHREGNITRSDSANETEATK